jgi:hypothetical protein
MRVMVVLKGGGWERYGGELGVEMVLGKSNWEIVKLGFVGVEDREDQKASCNGTTTSKLLHS